MATALAMAFSEKSDDADSEVVGAVEKGSSSANQADAPPRTGRGGHPLKVRRGNPNRIQASTLFQPKSWYVAPPPPPPSPASLLPPPPPPPPSAPQLPFTYIGRMIDRNEVILFLSKNDTQYVVKAQDVLDNNYRVDKITETEAVLTYIPLDTQQTLAFNAAADMSPPLMTASAMPSAATMAPAATTAPAANTPPATRAPAPTTPPPATTPSGAIMPPASALAPPSAMPSAATMPSVSTTPLASIAPPPIPVQPRRQPDPTQSTK